MRAGDTYIRASRNVTTDPHLWVVISDPGQDRSHLVAVNLTSQRTDKDQSCVIYPGEHPFVTNETVVMYSGARVVGESLLLAAKTAGMIHFHSAVSQDLLSRIRVGAERTDYLPESARQVLQAQRIIAEDDEPR